MDWSLPGSSVHGILQARILKWVSISFSKGSFRPRDQTQVSHIAGRCFNLWAIREAPHASKVMLKIFHARLQHYVNQELPDVQAGFRKGRLTRDQFDICWIIDKARELQKKTSTSLSSTTPKTLTMSIIIVCGKLLKRWEYQIILSASWEICMQVKKQQLEPYMDGTDDWFKIEKGVQQVCLLSPCLFNLYTEHIMRNSGLGELQAGIEIGGRNINNLRYDMFQIRW